jgi:Rhodopirellula transposase DDE domain
VQAQKKIKETDAIFARLAEINPAADRADDVLRLSLDAKAAVKVGPFSRGGKSRTGRKAADHDFKPERILTPYGIFLPRYDDLYLYFTPPPVTSDLIVDVLERWWRQVRQRFAQVTTLVINQDNGPENQSRRTQFLKRMVGFAREYKLLIRLAYYPPYHSKYNAIEHCWGVLESHWNGDLLDSVEAVLDFARTMTWNGKHPVVELLSGGYQKGVRLSAPEMRQVEAQVERLPKLGRWFVDIHGNKPSLG